MLSYFCISKIYIFLAQLMSRAAAGAFAYAPFAHGMWPGFSNTSTASSSPASQKYSGLASVSNASTGGASNANNFGYPPTPPKDSGKATIKLIRLNLLTTISSI